MKKHITKPIHYAFLGLMTLTFSFGAFANPIKESDIGKYAKTPAGKYYEIHGTADKPFIEMLGVASWPSHIDDGKLYVPVLINRENTFTEAGGLPKELEAAVRGEKQKPRFVVTEMKNTAFHNKSYMLKLRYYDNKPVIFEIIKNGLLRAKVIKDVEVKIHKMDGKLTVTNPLTQKKQELTIVDHASSPLEDDNLSREKYFELYNKYIIDPYNAAHHAAGGHAHRAHHAGHRHHDDHHHGGGGGGSGGH